MSGPSTVPSPCVSICALDENDICTGCQRTGMEIIQWGRLDDEGRRAILRRCEERARSQGLWLGAHNEGTKA